MLPSNNPGFYPQILGLPADFLFNQGKTHVQNYGFPSVNSEETMKKQIYIYIYILSWWAFTSRFVYLLEGSGGQYTLSTWNHLRQKGRLAGKQVQVNQQIDKVDLG